MPDALPRAFLRPPIAHRGLHDRAAGVIENSLEACAAAVAAGYGVEVDIQPAACGTPMVFHDPVLDRLTDARGPISAHTAEALGRIALRDGGGATIPRLADVLETVAGRGALLIEVKDQDGALGPAVGPLERAIAAALEGYPGPVAVMSFNPHGVAAFRAAAPHLPAGLTCDAFTAADWPGVPAARRAALAALEGNEAWDFISCGREALDRPPVAAFRASGRPVLTWTVRSPAEEAAARAFADNITFEGYRPAH